MSPTIENPSDSTDDILTADLHDLFGVLTRLFDEIGVDGPLGETLVRTATMASRRQPITFPPRGETSPPIWHRQTAATREVQFFLPFSPVPSHPASRK
jgi:hypothetical protein